jgi:hypothetical protein
MIHRLIKYLRNNVGDRNGLVILAMYETVRRGWISRQRALEMCLGTVSNPVAKAVTDKLESCGLIETKLEPDAVNGGHIEMRLTAAGYVTIKEAYRATKGVTQ